MAYKVHRSSSTNEKSPTSQTKITCSSRLVPFSRHQNRLVCSNRTNASCIRSSCIGSARDRGKCFNTDSRCIFHLSFLRAKRPQLAQNVELPITLAATMPIVLLAQGSDDIILKRITFASYLISIKSGKFLELRMALIGANSAGIWGT